MRLIIAVVLGGLLFWLIIGPAVALFQGVAL